MPRIFRIQGPGEHSVAEELLLFDADGIAESEDEAVLAMVQEFPKMFLILGAEDPIPGTPPEPWEDPDADDEEDLEPEVDPELEPDPEFEPDVDEEAERERERRRQRGFTPSDDPSPSGQGGLGSSPDPSPSPSPSPRLDAGALELMTVLELRELANQHHIPRASGMNKAELVAALAESALAESTRGRRR